MEIRNFGLDWRLLKFSRRRYGTGHAGLGFAAIILAAGESLGRGLAGPLSLHRGRTLVEHAVRNALAAGACEVLVVSGPSADKVRRRLCHLPVRVVENLDWREGLSSSIRLGVGELRLDPDAVVISLCDQPRITSAHLRKLAASVLAENGPSMAASSYEGVIGAPAAFARTEFQRLLALSGKHGARQLIRQASAIVETIEFADANASVTAEVRSDIPIIQWAQRLAEFYLDESAEARAPPFSMSPSLVHS